MDVSWPDFTLAILGILGIVGGALWRFHRRVVRPTARFLDDWNGQPASGGRPEIPGVMARIGRLEVTQAGLIAEMQPNSGSSLRDAIDRIERRLDDHLETGRDDAPTPRPSTGG